MINQTSDREKRKRVHLSPLHGIAKYLIPSTIRSAQTKFLLGSHRMRYTQVASTCSRRRDEGDFYAEDFTYGPVQNRGSVSLETEIKELHAKIGQLTMERDFLSGKLGR